jgi:hypothetical protein
MADGTVRLVSAAPQKSPQEINLNRLLREELAELVQHALQRDPDFTPIVLTAVARASLRPDINFRKMALKFDKELHSLDEADYYREREGACYIIEEVEKMIEKVAKSVNEDTPHEYVEEAFCCLDEFVDSVASADENSQLYMELEESCIMGEVAEAMQVVGKLLKAKGGSTIDGMMQHIEDNKIYSNGFEKVYEILWGDKDVKDENHGPPPKRTRR